MSVITLFGDESGTMPQKGNDEPFVCATVSVLGTFTSNDEPNNRPLWLIDALKKNDGIPYVTLVKPTSGYGNQLEAKVSKMDTMRRASNLAHGVTDATGYEVIELRNYVWIMCMSQAIVRTIGKPAFRSTIDAIRIVLDLKSFKKKGVELETFRKAVGKIPTRYREIIDELIPKIPARRAELLAARGNMKATEKDLELVFKDETTQNSADLLGLDAAHYLSKHTRNAILGRKPKNFLDMMKSNGYEDFVVDCTDKVVDTLNPISIASWRQNTGLPEPLK